MNVKLSIVQRIVLSDFIEAHFGKTNVSTRRGINASLDVLALTEGEKTEYGVSVVDGRVMVKEIKKAKETFAEYNLPDSIFLMVKQKLVDLDKSSDLNANQVELAEIMCDEFKQS